MIHIPDITEWNKLSDEDQIALCKAALNEYRRLKKPLYDILSDGYYAKDYVCQVAVLITHDWARIAFNLDYYTNDPKEGADDRTLRTQSIYNLRPILGILEFINRYLPNA